MRKLLTYLIGSLLSLSLTAQQADEHAVPDQLIVQLRAGVNAQEFFATKAQILDRLSKSMNIWLIKTDAVHMLPKLQADPSVRLAQYDHYISRRSLVPNDAQFGNQWSMKNLTYPGRDISATDAWQINHSSVTAGGDSIVVAVIDGTFDTHHEDINFFVNRHEIPYNGIDDDGNGYIDDYQGWNPVYNNDSVYGVFDNHATHCSGIVGAIGNNSLGVAGACWGVKILAINGTNVSDPMLENSVIKSCDYIMEMRKLYDQTAGAKGAFIVATSSSFGINRALASNYPIWCSMYDSLGYYGILSATATANANWDVDAVGDMPTTCPSRWMIGVTNTTATDIRSTAAYGATSIDLGAPGSNIISTTPGNNYGYDNGTSMATPLVAGTVALVVANACPRLLQDYLDHPDSISIVMRDYILNSTDPINALTNITTTGGRLNLYHSLLAESAYNCNNCNYTATINAQPVLCNGDSSGAITVRAGTSNSAYRFLWSNGSSSPSLSGLRSGYYQVTITDTTGCQRQLVALVAHPQTIAISSINVIPISASPGNIIVNASAGNDSLFYALDGGSYQASNILITSDAGVHTIHVKNKYGCVVDATVGLYHTGIEDEQVVSFNRIEPNPSSGAALLELNTDRDMTVTINIADMTGRMLISEPVTLHSGMTQVSMDGSSLSDGIYLIAVSRESKPIQTLRWMVAR